MFQAKIKEFWALQRIYREMPKKFNYASANLLNTFAFGTKKQTFVVISREMIVRKPGFVRSSVRVTKANGRIDVNKQKSICGSIYRDKFTGWREQELLEETTRTKTITPLARNNVPTKILPGRFRLKKSNEFMSPDHSDYASQADKHKKSVMMLNILAKKGHKKPFKVFGHDKLRSGLYVFKGVIKKVTVVKDNKKRTYKRRDIGMIQKFDNKVQPKPIAWMSQSRIEYFRSINLSKLWESSLERQRVFKK